MTRVILLFGGTSTERRVSVASAQNLCSVLPGAEPWFIARDGSVHAVPVASVRDAARPFELEFEPPAGTRQAASVPEALDGVSRDTVFFLALHGGDGENGRLQGELERRRLAFTGAGSIASEAAFDKMRAKQIVSRHGVRIAAGSELATGEEAIAVQLKDLMQQHGALVAKPVADGSSIGLHHVRQPERLGEIAAAIAATGARYLVEPFVQGTELTVGVIDDGTRLLALPPSEVRVEASFDYDAKYLGRGSREITPAEVSPAVTDSAQQIALTAHRTLGCEGYSRTDLIATPAGIVFIETNTLPGLTRASFIPQQLAAAGRTLQDFVQTQIRLAIARRDRSAPR